MFFYIPSFNMALIVLVVSILLDTAYPYHKGILLRIHPVHTCFIMAKKLVKPYASKLYGVFLGLTCILTHLMPLLIILYMISLTPQPWSIISWILVSALTLKVSCSIRLLAEICLKAYRYSRTGDWGFTKYWVQQLVRRNVYELDEEHTLSAAIESLSESLVDGIVSPLLYYPLLGITGPFLQRLINTLDGAVGYKKLELINQGWFSAKLDTILNYIPARLAALYIIISSIILGYNWRNSWKIYLRDRGNTESLNAGHPMSAIAGALNIMLEKVGHYRLGDRLKPIEPKDVLRATKIVLVSILLHIIIVLVIMHTIFILLK